VAYLPPKIKNERPTSNVQRRTSNKVVASLYDLILLFHYFFHSTLNPPEAYKCSLAFGEFDVHLSIYCSAFGAATGFLSLSLSLDPVTTKTDAVVPTRSLTSSGTWSR